MGRLAGDRGCRARHGVGPGGRRGGVPARTLAGLDLVRANALKMLVVLTFTPLALLLFVAGGRVEWVPGLAVAVGSVAGADLGVRFTLGRSQRSLRLVVNATLVAFAFRLWFL